MCDPLGKRRAGNDASVSIGADNLGALPAGTKAFGRASRITTDHRLTLHVSRVSVFGDPRYVPPPLFSPAGQTTAGCGYHSDMAIKGSPHFAESLFLSLLFLKCRCSRILQ